MYHLIDPDGNEYGPIVADNPKVDTYRHESILTKVTKWAAMLGCTWRKGE